MRRRETQITSSTNLLLDTLSNALGGVIFIALLVVLIAYQVPVLDSSESVDQQSTKDTEALIEELQARPSTMALTKSLNEYTLALADYQSSDLQPLSVTRTLEELVKERGILIKQTPKSTPKKTNYHVPSLRQIPSSNHAYIAVFKGNQVFSAPLNVTRFQPGQTLKIKNLEFLFQQNSLVIDIQKNEGATVREALHQLLSVVRSQNSQLQPRTTQLFLFVYPDSINEFHTYRKQAMKSLPYTNWIGLTEKSYPRLSFKNQNDPSSGNNIGF